jgi:hypothetical protein
MNTRSFALEPFSPDLRPALQVTGQLARRGQTLALHYALLGPLSQVVIPAPAAAPARRQGLWQETCFEFFLGVKDAPGYWEFNLSPARDWNVYRFSDYRQGMAAEPAMTSLPFGVHRGEDFLRLDLEVDLAVIVPAGRTLELCLAAVVKPLRSHHCFEKFKVQGSKLSGAPRPPQTRANSLYRGWRRLKPALQKHYLFERGLVLGGTLGCAPRRKRL